jgi:hypothetical protein
VELPDELELEEELLEVEEELLELDEVRPELDEELLELEELDEVLDDELEELELGLLPEELDEEPELLEELDAVGSPSAPQPDSPATQSVSAINFFAATNLFAAIHPPFVSIWRVLYEIPHTKV